MIETRALTVHLGGAPTLDGITARFQAGRLTAIVGPNGAGKSTLVSAIGRLVPATSGEVRIEGRPLRDWTGAALALRLAILRQNPHLTMRLTVRDLVGFGRYPHARGRLGDEDRRIVADCLERLDLAALAGRMLDTLSGGQRQRALIAMALAQDTPALVLDEPLNNLDLAHARRVMALARTAARQGRAVVAVLHDLTVAARHADHIVALKDGRLAAEGPPAAVMTEPILSALYGTEVKVVTVDGHPVVLTT